ncbi:MAG: hypothetical protein N2322_01620 [Terrimicrobiaceae bacterium]|nr:hypothetical protein [Terrimicrobiaceae bacterium]
MVHVVDVDGHADHAAGDDAVRAEVILEVNAGDDEAIAMDFLGVNEAAARLHFALEDAGAHAAHTRFEKPAGHCREDDLGLGPFDDALGAVLD